MAKVNEKAIVDAFVATVGESFDCESRDAAVSVESGRLSAEIIFRLAVHGARQKLGDSVSALKGKPAADLVARMVKVRDSLYNGEWSDRTSRLFSVARGVLESAYPKAEIPAKGEFALRDAKSLAFWCERMHVAFPSDKLPQGPRPDAVLAKAERIMREREAAVDELA